MFAAASENALKLNTFIIVFTKISKENHETDTDYLKFINNNLYIFHKALYTTFFIFSFYIDPHFCYPGKLVFHILFLLYS